MLAHVFHFLTLEMPRNPIGQLRKNMCKWYQLASSWKKKTKNDNIVSLYHGM